MESIATVGYAAQILAALRDGIAAHQRSSAPKHGLSEQDMKAITHRLKANASHLEIKIVSEISPESPVAAIAHDSARVLNDIAVQVASMPVEGQAKKSMLGRFKLTKKPSNTDLQRITGMKMRLEEPILRLDELLSEAFV